MRRQLLPELVLQRDAGLVPVDGDRAFTHAWIVTAARRPLNLPCRCHEPCVYTAPDNPPFRTHRWTSATSPSSPTSTMARPRWSTTCSSSPARSATTSRSPSAPWTPTTWSASAASPSWPSAPRSSGRAPASTSSTRPATPTSAARSSASCRWSTACVLLVDAAEGVVPQTKFVLGKALKLGLRPIVVINKVDRSDARAHEVHDEVFDLFAALGRHRRAARLPDALRLGPPGLGRDRARGRAQGPGAAVRPDRAATCRRPRSIRDPPFRMLVTTLEADPFLGRLLTGRIESGAIKPNMTIKALGRDGKELEQTPHHQAAGLPRPGARAGRRRPKPATSSPSPACQGATVADTLCDLTLTEPIASPADRSADPRHDLLGQRLPAGRPRRRQGHHAHDPRPPDARRPKATSPSTSPTPRTPTPSRSPAAANCSSAC